MNCKICNKKTNKLTEATIFARKKIISYYKCETCKFIQSQEPDWLEESYSDVIAKTDIGLMARNIKNSEFTEKFIYNVSPEINKCLDFGAGYGVFVRIMRDKGFNFLWHDDYCQNLFAEFFEGSISEEYDLVTAFEVFEHLPQPMDTITKLTSMTSTILFSTLTTDNVDDFENWWYRGEATGQHVSFYHTDTLKFIASKLNINYNALEENNFHVFTKKAISKKALKNLNSILNDRFMKKFSNMFIKFPKKMRVSLLEEDYNYLIKKTFK